MFKGWAAKDILTALKPFLFKVRFTNPPRIVYAGTIDSVFIEPFGINVFLTNCMHQFAINDVMFVDKFTRVPVKAFKKRFTPKLHTWLTPNEQFVFECKLAACPQKLSVRQALKWKQRLVEKWEIKRRKPWLTAMKNWVPKVQ